MLIFAWKMASKTGRQQYPSTFWKGSQNWKEEKVTLPTSNGRKSLRAPQKIMVLGDLLELWEPQSGNLTTPI
ncbi:MAG TPA: hypothetical protein VED16_02190 [Candidatus Acidoferrum sp.]|nr:hypothetical protein [Candidatus Acidoferrum sp.]